jgi:hypothetical protein
MTISKRKKNIYGRRAWLAFRADNPAAISKPIVWTVWEFQYFAALYASVARYGEGSTFHK